MTPVRQSPGRFVAGAAVLAIAVGLGSLLPTALSVYLVRDIALLLSAAAVAGLAWANPRFSIGAVVAAFVFSGLLRRLVPAADPASDMAAIFPFLVALPLAIHGARFKKPAAIVVLLLWATVGAALSLRTPLVSLGGWLNLAVPLLAAFGIRSIPSGMKIFAQATVICGAMAATYGIVQYVVPFRWDVTWLAGSGISSAGTFGESNFRPFATLPAPQTAAMLCAVVILIVVFRGQLLGSSTALRVWAVSSSSILLLLTLARTVWLALAAALLVGLLATKGRPARQLVPLVAVAVLFVSLAPQGEAVVGRAGTLTDLSEDKSFNARLDIVGAAGAVVSPFGIGLGTLSAASRADETTVLDNGYVVVLGELGLVGLGLLVWALVWVVRQSRPSEYAFVAMLLVTAAGSFVFGNLTGLLLWTFSGIGLAREDDTTSSPTSTAPNSGAAPALCTATLPPLRSTR
ncbi:MAG: hypothetical protein M3535_02270 [Actinomycetota bacterium]|nr:hypothetical protein [Actinomycetota bacterium]